MPRTTQELKTHHVVNPNLQKYLRLLQVEAVENVAGFGSFICNCLCLTNGFQITNFNQNLIHVHRAYYESSTISTCCALFKNVIKYAETDLFTIIIIIVGQVSTSIQYMGTSSLLFGNISWNFTSIVEAFSRHF